VTSLLPGAAGNQLANGARAAGAAALIPTITLVTADGSEAANPAVAAAGIVVGGLIAETGKPPPNCDDDDPVMIVLRAAEAVVSAGLPDIDTDVTDEQWRAVNKSEKGWARLWQARGHIVHDRTAARLAAQYGRRFVYHRVGVDFFDRQTGRWVELTTRGELKKHRDKGGDYETCDYALYKWKE
jgi:hypothetical protein